MRLAQTQVCPLPLNLQRMAAKVKYVSLYAERGGDPSQTIDGFIKIGVIEYDERRISSSFQGHPRW